VTGYSIDGSLGSTHDGRRRRQRERRGARHVVGHGVGRQGRERSCGPRMAFEGCTSS
jgi:hypothetical protein